MESNVCWLVNKCRVT